LLCGEPLFVGRRWLRPTSSTGFQLRVVRDHRLGFRDRAS
jgi:hypothetical protein